MARRGRRYGRGALGGVTLIAAAIGGLGYLQASTSPVRLPSLAGARNPDCTVEDNRTSCVSSSQPASATAASTSPYADGTYAAQGVYLTPGGDEAIGVQLTIRAGRVIRSEIDVEATSPTARQFQRQFATRYAAQVMSRDLASLSISRVAGASLTSLGFDNALATIRTDAHVDQ